MLLKLTTLILFTNQVFSKHFSRCMIKLLFHLALRLSRPTSMDEQFHACTACDCSKRRPWLYCFTN